MLRRRVGGADLGQLPVQAQAVQPQLQVMAAGEDEPQLHRGAHDQQLELAQGPV